MITAPAPSAAPTAAPASPKGNGNPWGFPPLDPKVATATLKGLDKAEEFMTQLIDGGIDVRVMLDRDLKAKTWSADTVKAVDLLTQARTAGIKQLTDQHLTHSLDVAIHDWTRANAKDDRLRVVSSTLFDIEHATADFLDDDEGNVRDEINSMREQPGQQAWAAVRSSLDASIGSMYGVRGSLEGARHVVRAAGLYEQ